MYNKIVASLCEGSFLRKIRETLDRGIGAVCRHFIMKNTPVQDNKVVFMTYNNSYSCNPKYIAEEFRRRNLPIELVWLTDTKAKKNSFPSGIILARRERALAYYHMATAKIWVDNSINSFWRPVYKKKEQYLFETWHGSMGLKRVGKDDVLNKRWLRSAKKCAKNTNFCLSNSDFEDMVFKTTHWPNAECLHYGHARNDILFLSQDDEEYLDIRNRVLEFYNSKSRNGTNLIDANDKLILYAPTWRDDGRLDCYDIDFGKLINSLEKKFGGTWKVLFRMHFHDRKKTVLIPKEMESRIIPATDYPDMQELMLISDIGITDYSSWACDFVLTQKPLFIYATDLEQYNTERGLYYPLETTPFPIAVDNETLCANVESFDSVSYINKCDEFLKDKGCYESGQAAKLTVDKMLELMGDI